MIVGADGRTSTVRRQLGVSLTQAPPNSLGGGMLRAPVSLGQGMCVQVTGPARRSGVAAADRTSGRSPG
ncbi:hypothetical protein ABZ424_04075 [Streptomyces sp. NPDC005790]|uniref:hypothetical protein n=1 Tax=Streptomyces sp. NPDC005790 TaxID=3154777 RepID=UPI0033C59DF1